MAELSGMRTLVVGASSGIGRATALHLAKAGARVAATARRRDPLEELASDAPGITAIAFDASDERACAEGVERAIASLGGLDALVHAAGVIGVGEAPEIEPAEWRRVIEANLFGAVWTLRASTPALRRTRGRAIVLGSRSADDVPPRRGVGPYIVSKAALHSLVSVWQEECPEIAITRVSVGDTGATEMGTNWDPEVTQRVIDEWNRRGFLVGRAMVPEDVARHVAHLLETDEHVPVSSIFPRPPAGVAPDEAG